MITTFARCVTGGVSETVLLENGVAYRLEGDMFGEFTKGPALCSIDEAERFLPPVMPSKIPSVGLNYRDHAKEVGLPIPEEPLLFLKPPTTVIGHKDTVIYPAHMSERVDYEAELGIVIGRKCFCVEAKDALKYVLGYTCANDVTARDLQTKDGQWTRAKSFDTFCPLGPCIVSGIDPSNLEISLLLNGREVQRSNTSNFIFPVEVLVSHISKVMTLLPGDVIITGTPSGIGPVKKGDVMEVKIEGIGVLENSIGA